MTTHPVYDRLLEQVDDALERKVLIALLEVAGQRVTRPDLVFKVFGVYVQQKELNSSTEDRKVREAIERLQKRDYPIMASSGEAGYVLAADDETVDAYIAELVSREKNLHEKVAALRRSRRWVQFIHDWRSSAQLRQPSLF